MHIWYGYDANSDGVTNDIYTTAYRYTGIDNTGVPSYKEIGPCKTVNCGRGAALSQLNLRVSKAVPIGRLTAELIGEVFNVTNAINPAFNPGTMAPRFFTGTLANHSANSAFMRPAGFAGDAGQPEQRVGQVGIRITFNGSGAAAHTAAPLSAPLLQLSASSSPAFSSAQPLAASASRPTPEPSRGMRSACHLPYGAG